MRMRCPRAGVFALLFAALAPWPCVLDVAEVGATVGVRGKPPPKPVKIGVYVQNFHGLKDMTGKSTIDFTVSMQWQDSAAKAGGAKDAVFGLHEVKHEDFEFFPRMLILNRGADSHSVEFGGSVHISADGAVTLLDRFHTELQHDLHFAKFPFDTQASANTSAHRYPMPTLLCAARR